MYCNCCCSCSFEPEIIKSGLPSHKMYSNNILNFQESTTILNACTKKSGNLLNAPHKYVQMHLHTDARTTLAYTCVHSYSYFMCIYKHTYTMKALSSHPYAHTYKHMHAFTLIYHHQVMLIAQISLTLSLSSPPSLSIRPYQPMFPLGPSDYILCLHRPIVGKFLLVG